MPKTAPSPIRDCLDSEEIRASVSLELSRFWAPQPLNFACGTQCCLLHADDRILTADFPKTPNPQTLNPN